jgi:Mg2+/Co2+ transporter CorB
LSDEIPLGTLFLILGILLTLSAFFSGTETALMRVNKYRIKHMSKKGHKGAKLAEKLLKEPDKLIAFILFGNNLVNFIAASIVGVVSMKIGGPTGVALGTFLLTVIVLLFAESAPKTIAAIFPEKIALKVSILYYPLVKMMRPFLIIINFFTNIILKIIGSVPSQRDEQLSIEELKTLIHEGMTRTSKDRQKIMMGVLDLGNVTVEDIMLPHNEIIGIDLSDSSEVNKKKIEQHLYSQLPIFDNVLDNIQGVLDLTPFLKKIDLDSFNNAIVLKHIKKPYFIPEKTTLSQQLFEFKRKKEKIGFAVDEYGNIQGLVTIEDIFEEIVGDYLEETKKLNNEMRPIKDGEDFLVNAASNVRSLNKMMNWEIPVEEAKTLNGAILEQLGYIPDQGYEIILDRYKIIIVKTKENAIQTVRIKETDPDYKLKAV